MISAFFFYLTAWFAITWLGFFCSVAMLYIAARRERAAATALHLQAYTIPIMAGPMPMIVDKNAHTTSIELLRSWLSPEQLLDFNARQTFDCIGSSSGRRYTIFPGTTNNVVRDDGMRLCFGPSSYHGSFPLGDVQLAQKIMIENDEESVLRVANKTPQYGPAGPPMPSTIVSSGACAFNCDREIWREAEATIDLVTGIHSLGPAIEE
jgi:hypothetical protein